MKKKKKKIELPVLYVLTEEQALALLLRKVNKQKEVAKVKPWEAVDSYAKSTSRASRYDKRSKR